MGYWALLRKRLKAAHCLALAVVLLAPGIAEATTTRIYTLGVMNRFIIDDANKWLYPHVITKYGNLFYIELFGSTPSKLDATPGSRRTLDLPPDTTLSDVDLQILDATELVPVQADAGGGAIFGITDDIFVGVHLSDHEDDSVLTMLNYLASGSGPGGPLSKGPHPNAFPWLGMASPPDGKITPSNRKFDLFAAYNLQDLAQFGLLFTYASSKYKRDADEAENDAVATNLAGDVREDRFNDKLGVQTWGFVLSGGAEITEAAAVDGALGLTFHGLTYKPQERNNLIDGGGGIEFRADARAFIGVTEWWEIVPAITFKLANLSVADLADYQLGLTYDDTSGREDFEITDASIKHILFDVGVAGHLRPTDYIDFWIGVGALFQRVSSSFDHQVTDDPDNFDRVAPQFIDFRRDTRTTDALPYIRLALEARIFSWLDFRGGVIKFLRADTVRVDQAEDANNEMNLLNDTTEDYPFFDYFVGLAAHYQGFFLDVHLDPEWFMRGPEFLGGGTSGAANMFVNASLGYQF